MQQPTLPPGQQRVARDKWPPMGERLPRQDASPWNVFISGEVGHPQTFTLDDLRSLPFVERTIDLHCVTRWSKLNVRFGGVLLATLLERSNPTDAARFASFVARSDRHHSTSLPLADALSLDALLALEAEGEPLPTERGGPVRVIVPGRYFYKSLKWLERIELLADDRLGYWEATAGYHNTADPWLQQRYIASNLSKIEAQAILAQRDLAGRELLSLDARGLDLAGLDARDALLRNADFRDSRLRGACFDKANLTNANFRGADLAGASFRGADLEGADFSAAILHGACLLESSLVAASFGTPTSDAAIVDECTAVPQTAREQLTPDQLALLLDLLARAGSSWR